MLDLHSRLQALAATSGRLDIVYIDDPSDPASRDRAMAQRVLEARSETPDSLIIVLTGNLHNRLTRGNLWNPDYEPMGLFIAREVPESAVTSLELSYDSGSAWICQGELAADCGVARLKGNPSTSEGIVLQRNSADRSVSGYLYLGSITASLPAKEEPLLSSGRAGWSNPVVLSPNAS